MGIRFTSGEGYELLIGAVAVADARWRSVLSQGEGTYQASRAVARDAGRLGRLGWINQIPLLLGTDGSRAALLDAVLRLDPDELRRVVTGGRRLEPPARAELTPWLRKADAADVRQLCLRVLTALPAPSDVPRPARRVRGRAVEVLEAVAPGVRYDAMVGDLVLAACAAVHPVIVVVDEPGTTVVAHPPLVGGEPTDAGARLRLMARAAGDPTRMRVLQELRAGPRTLPQLCETLASPRTTLLHHLALLRGAGLIDVLVAEPRPNTYRLRESGFDDLARASEAFIIR